jgi:hypothetical protein
MYYDSEDYTIREVTKSKDWYSISTTGSTCFGLKKKWGKVPKVGDIVTLHTKNFSHIVGMDLNGERCFLFTEAELDQHRIEELARMEKEKMERFEREREQMDKDYEALPECFKKRIDRFRANNPDFRVDYEGYELFCCNEAVKIAHACKTPETILKFKSKKWEVQKRMVPTLSDGHSGNTFGCAVHLAYWYLTNEDGVIKTHGSLSPLVGSDAFGDVAKDE